MELLKKLNRLLFPRSEEYEKLGAKKALALGFQHAFAMSCATILVPLLTGLDVGVALFCAGCGTLIFHLCTGGRMPTFLGSSFAFISALCGVIGNANFGATYDEQVSAAMGGIIVAGAFYLLLSIIIRLCGKGLIDKLFPPVVRGVGITLIGLNLASSAINNIQTQYGPDGQALPIFGEGYDMPTYVWAWVLAAIVCLTAVVLSLLFNSIAGYAFARLRFRGARVMFLLLMVGLMMPPQVTMLPTFLIMAKFPLAGGNNLLGAGGTGLINTYAGLVIPLVSGSYGVFLCKQFYENFPRSLDEAAEIDGANKWRTYFTIYLPNSKAILATLGLLKAVSVWNDYMWPLIMTNSENMRTVQLALTMFKTDSGIMWNQMMAGSVLVALPMFVLFLCAQKYFIQGIVTSGLK